MDEYTLQIFNRWGLLLFETTAPQVKWDGTTNSGEQVPAGVYYFVLKAKSATTNYEKNGTVTVLYNSDN
jgi:gliding motility-associated-like protein